MSVNFGTFKLGIPPNFKEVLEALTREILKEQPTDVATFSAIFLNELLEKREQGLDTRFIVKRQEAIAIKSSTSQFMKVRNEGGVTPPTKNNPPIMEESTLEKEPPTAAEHTLVIGATEETQTDCERENEEEKDSEGDSTESNREEEPSQSEEQKTDSAPVEE